MRALLDSNVLIALALRGHVQHDAAEVWLAAQGDYATCPVTQGALVRMAIRVGRSGPVAAQLLAGLIAPARHEFWADDIAYNEVPLTGVLGHRQVTDAYLAALARHRGGRLATFDRALAGLHADVAVLVPGTP
ncbi:MAG TPA: TA system VapC family ribonuclease toxin [Actinomycetota bacterium]|nr:TA system VapC family ribonuclease toxin [Actinomycetota bacterium]